MNLFLERQSALSTFRSRLLAGAVLLLTAVSLVACGGSGSSGQASSGSGSGSSSGSGGSSGGSGGSGTSGGSSTVSFNSISGGTTGLSNPLDIAVDAAGNIWATNYAGGFGSSSPGSVTELTKASNFSASSAVNFSGPSTGLNGSKFLAIDPSGNVWITNSYGSNSVTELTKASGYSPSSAVVISGGNTAFNGPCGILADPAGNIWIANLLGDSVTELPASAISASNATGQSIAIAARNISGGNTNFGNPVMLAMDRSGNLWMTNVGFVSGNGLPGLTELTKASNYSAASAVNITLGNTNTVVIPFDIASDTAGNIWMTAEIGVNTGNPNNPTLSAGIVKLTQSTNYSLSQAMIITGFATGNDIPLGLAIDGAGNVWFTNIVAPFNTSANQLQITSGTVVELTKASNYSASSAITFSGPQAGFNTPIGIAVDGSGNVWVANSSIGLVNGQVGTSGNTSNIIEMPGAATGTNPPIL